MKKLWFVLGLVLLSTIAVVSAESFVLWNSKPVGLTPDLQEQYGISDYDSLLDYAVLHDFYIPKNTNEQAWRSLNQRYNKYMAYDCDYVQTATPFRPAKVFDNNGWRDSNAVCHSDVFMPMFSTHTPVKPLVVVVPEEVLENETLPVNETI